MYREKVILRKQKLGLNKAIRLLRKLDKATIIPVSILMSIVVLCGSLSILSTSSLTSIARQNYSTVVKMDNLQKEIDSLKLELIEATNIIKIQQQSRDLGFVYEGNVKYVK